MKTRNGAESVAYVLGVISATAAHEKSANWRLRLLERLGPNALAMYRHLFNKYPRRFAPVANRFRPPVPGWLLGAAGGSLLTDVSENAGD